MDPRRMEVGLPLAGGPAPPPPGASLFGCVRPTEGGNGRGCGGDEAKLNSCTTTQNQLACQKASSLILYVPTRALRMIGRVCEP